MLKNLLIASVLIIVSAFGSSAQDIQELFPDNNVSVKYIVEFRARSGVPGHAFVALGRELDNGLIVFEAVGGFYPEDGRNNIKTVKNLAFGPGVVDYKWSDLQSDQVLRVPISQETVSEIAKEIAEWDDKNYSLAINNCVDMAKDVAKIVGIPVDGTSKIPAAFVKDLKERHARMEQEARAAEEARRAAAAQKAENQRRIVEAAREQIEQIRRQQEQLEMVRRAQEQAEAARRAQEQAEAARRAQEQAEAARRAAQPPIQIPRLP